MKRIPTILVTAALLFTFSTASEAQGITEHFGSSAIVAFPGYTAAETLTNFPMSIQFTSGSRIDIADIDPDGVRFVDSDGNELPYEIDFWDTTSHSAALWVLVPELAADTTLTMLYDPDTGAPAKTRTAEEVWADYHGVWHMDLTAGGGVYDSTSNHWDSAFTSTSSSAIVTPGVIGNAVAFGTAVAGFKVDPEILAGIFGRDGLTMECFRNWRTQGQKLQNWTPIVSYFPAGNKVITWVPNYGTAPSSRYPARLDYMTTNHVKTYPLEADGDCDLVGRDEGDYFFSGVTIGDGHYLSINDTTVRAMDLSVSTIVDSDSSTNAAAHFLSIGCRISGAKGTVSKQYNGDLDEIRIRNGRVSLTWFETVRDSVQSADSFTTITPADEVSITCNATGVATHTTIGLSIGIDNIQSDAMPVVLVASTEEDLSHPVFSNVVMTVSANGTYAYTLSNLAPSTTYYCRAFAVNGTDVAPSLLVSASTENCTFTVCGIGMESTGPSSLTLSAAVIDVTEGVSYGVTLYENGSVLRSWTGLTGKGTYSYASTLSQGADISFVFTYAIETYTGTVTTSASFDPTSGDVALFAEDLSNLQYMAVIIGDRIALPVPPSGCSYAADAAGLYTFEPNSTILVAGSAGSTEVVVEDPSGNPIAAYALRILPAGTITVQYVSPDGNDENSGTTQDLPKATIQAALDTIDALGVGTVYVGAGTYEIRRGFVLTNAIDIVGLTGNPNDVVVTNVVHEDTSVQIFRIDNPKASVRSLTAAHGNLRNSSIPGAACIHIAENGGTVSNCVARGGRGYNAQWENAEGISVFGAKGLVTHCIVEDCRFTTGQTSWTSITGFANGLGIYATAGRVENCLVRNCHGPGGTSMNPDYAFAVPVYLDYTAKAINLTVVGNTADKTGGIYLRRDATAMNCVVCDNTCLAPADGYADCNAWWSDNTAANFITCAFDTASPINPGCIAGTAETFFEDYGAGDLRPIIQGDLFNKGTLPDSVPTVDLAGRPRVVERIDIGAYEAAQAASLIMLR